VYGQSARKSRPRELLLLSTVIKHGFGKPASVKIPGANEKDPVVHGDGIKPKAFETQKRSCKRRLELSMDGPRQKLELSLTFEGICLFHGMPLNSRA
jgi:hypothetical protein